MFFLLGLGFLVPNAMCTADDLDLASIIGGESDGDRQERRGTLQFLRFRYGDQLWDEGGILAFTFGKKGSTYKPRHATTLVVK
ncbi:hypothetical protein O9992_22105 [Vibrio lentus]|nr:hypothetical protein [Vibrio lentus]